MNRADTPGTRPVASAVRADGRWFRDEGGRILTFHGVNVSGRAKRPPFLAFPPEDRYLDPLAGWGFNLARLLLIWEAIEPERGTIDESYLDRAVELARALTARGVHVLVDLHQDVFARAFGGDGAPDWALPPGSPGVPAWLRGPRWFLAYFLSPAVADAERDFWLDERGIQGRFLKVLERVAERFRDVEGVVGYDVLNEPMAPPRWLLSGWFERVVLPAFYQRAVAAVRRADPARLVFVEPAPISSSGRATGLGPVEGPGIAYAPHLYDFLAQATGTFRGGLASTLPFALKDVEKVRNQRGWPVVIGEFGALNGVGRAPEMLESQVATFERSGLSWTAWTYDPVGPDWNDEGASLVEVGGAERPWLAPLVRPYARAVAGSAPRARFDRAQRTFRLDFAVDPGRVHPDAVTEVFLAGERTWPEGPTVDADGADAELDAARDVVVLRNRPGAKRVRLTLAPSG